MTTILLALALVLGPAPQEPLPRESDLDRVLDELSPAQRLERRVTPEVLVVEKARPAVVFVTTRSYQDVREPIWGQLVGRNPVTGSGSGVVILQEGFVITNYHVVRGAEAIRVSFAPEFDSNTYSATVVSRLEERDLALLKIHAAPDRRFRTLALGTSDDLMIGERVLAIGNPHGQALTVSSGIVSGLHRDIAVPTGVGNLRFAGLIQTDASINRGNSGGPLLNINGELIGINTAMDVQADNIGFAIPVDQLRVVLEDLLNPDRYVAWMGFRVEGDADPRVVEIVPGSPAEQAGLLLGDRLVALEGVDVRSAGVYRLARLAVQPGPRVPIKVERGGEPLDLELAAWNHVDGLLFERMGILVRTTSQRVRPQGTRAGNPGALEVVRVAPGGPADLIEMRVGDLLESARPLDEPELRRHWSFFEPRQLYALVDRLAAGARLEVDVRRGQLRNTGVMVLR